MKLAGLQLVDASWQKVGPCSFTTTCYRQFLFFTVLIYANLGLHGLDMLSVFAIQNLHILGLKQTFKV
jgi:hypothetical protein